MNDLAQDLHYGSRMLLKSPGTTAAIVLSLALGIGANATIFSFVDALFFESLPVPDADRVAVVYSSSSRPGDSSAGGLQGYLPLSYPNFEDIRDRAESFSGMAAYTFAAFNLSGGGEPEQVQGRIVSAS